MPADIDIGQVLVIAIAMVAAFVQWVWKLMQDAKEARERARRQQDRARSGDLPQEKEVTIPPPIRPQPPASPQPPKGGLWDLVETLKEEMKKAQEGPLVPPPLVPPPIPQVPSRVAQSPAPVSPPVAVPKSVPIPSPVSAVVATPRSGNTIRDGAVDVRASVMNLDALRQAIILNEVLGPPKALQ